MENRASVFDRLRSLNQRHDHDISVALRDRGSVRLRSVSVGEQLRLLNSNFVSLCDYVHAQPSSLLASSARSAALAQLNAQFVRTAAMLLTVPGVVSLTTTPSVSQALRRISHRYEANTVSLFGQSGVVALAGASADAAAAPIPATSPADLPAPPVVGTEEALLVAVVFSQLPSVLGQLCAACPKPICTCSTDELRHVSSSSSLLSDDSSTTPSSPTAAWCDEDCGIVKKKLLKYRRRSSSEAQDLLVGM